MPSESVWSALTPAPIVFKTSQTPLIFDPFSTIVRASISVCEKKKILHAVHPLFSSTVVRKSLCFTSSVRRLPCRALLYFHCFQALLDGACPVLAWCRCVCVCVCVRDMSVLRRVRAQPRHLVTQAAQALA